MSAHILVVDDVAKNVKLFVDVLEARGYRTSAAASGEEALRALGTDPPDLVLLDVMMPGLDGWQVAEELIDGDATSSIPIVFLTARAEARDRARGLDLGGIDYVTKPFNPVELAPLVRDLIARVDRGEREELRREKIAELRDLLDPPRRDE
jgi:adenylate cyclase